MVGPCAQILNCAERQVHYKFNFPGNQVHDPHAHGGSINDGIVDPGHYHEEPMSTHGISLNLVGGNVPVAPGTNPELAASAVTPTESVV